MNPFRSRKSAAEYTFMSDGYDGREVIDVLGGYLAPGSTVLEVGMGPGRDIELLEEKYRVTGSDISPAFLDLYREKHPDADLLELDLVTLDASGRHFDCIYSNKVIHYLSPEMLEKSIRRQHEVLNPGGILCHTLWYGDKQIEVKGMTFHYYTEETFMKCVGPGFESLLAKPYAEMISHDSILMVLKKSGKTC